MPHPISPELLDALVMEAAQALRGIKTVTDLDKRIGVLRDRAEVSNDRLAAFIVTMPEGMNDEDRATFTREVSASLENIVKDAMSQVEYERMWGYKNA